ncbi:hypothetical protein A2608_02775 [Candidatus Azambacteria bacterium RIFOXYD1_FULL_44_10]|nr:MAG: hypothetical protein A2608_02775 [Candidatus Azambacteria bacterium RIFOXYD1_FULL_44_10]
MGFRNKKAPPSSIKLGWRGKVSSPLCSGPRRGASTSASSYLLLRVDQEVEIGQILFCPQILY